MLVVPQAGQPRPAAQPAALGRTPAVLTCICILRTAPAAAIHSQLCQGHALHGDGTRPQPGRAGACHPASCLQSSQRWRVSGAVPTTAQPRHPMGAGAAAGAAAGFPGGTMPPLPRRATRPCRAPLVCEMQTTTAEHHLPWLQQRCPRTVCGPGTARRPGRLRWGPTLRSRLAPPSSAVAPQDVHAFGCACGPRTHRSCPAPPCMPTGSHLGLSGGGPPGGWRKRRDTPHPGLWNGPTNPKQPPGA